MHIIEETKYSIEIDAPREKVWRVMIEDKSYRDWTSAFCPNSHFEGDWSEGSEIRFLGDGPNGESGGMFSRIRENKSYERISIEHLGILLVRCPDSCEEPSIERSYSTPR